MLNKGDMIDLLEQQALHNFKLKFTMDVSRSAPLFIPSLLGRELSKPQKHRLGLIVGRRVTLWTTYPTKAQNFEWRGGDPTDLRSTTNYCFLLDTSLISWQSKKHTVVARSSTVAEYRALVDTTPKLLWLWWLLQDMCVSLICYSCMLWQQEYYSDCP